MKGTIFRPGPMLGLTRFYPAPRPMAPKPYRVPRALGYGHPPPPGVCCQKDPAGNTVCSDGNIYPPG